MTAFWRRRPDNFLARRGVKATDRRNGPTIAIFCCSYKMAAGPGAAAREAWEDNMSFGLYVLGYLILIVGLIYGATLMHVPSHWIVAGAIVLAGLGIVTGVKNTRQKDSAN